MTTITNGILAHLACGRAQLHPEVHKVCAIDGALVVLPDGADAVHSVSAHRVHHILGTVQVFLNKSPLVDASEAINLYDGINIRYMMWEAGV